MPVTVRVLYFQAVAAATGINEESLDLADSASLDDVADAVVARHPAVAALRGALLVARNQEMAAWEATVQNGDEVALMPPFSGG